MKNFDEVDFDKYLKSMSTEIFLKDKEGKYIFVNKPDSNWIKPGVDVIGKFDKEVHVDLHMAATCREEDLKVLQTGQRVRTVNKAVDNDGQEVYYEIVKSPVRDENGAIVGLTGIAIDITDRVKLEYKLLNYYQTDVLTGLYNRHYLEKWQKNKNIKLPLSIMILDCNNLKYFNDNYGHEMGDKLLQLVAEVIREVLPANCISFRVGGDEFAIFCNETDEEKAIELKAQLKAALQAKSLKNVKLSASIGYACMTDKNQKLHCIYAKADNNMYQDKRRYHENHDSE